jgi:stage III sporulation protein AA
MSVTQTEEKYIRDTLENQIYPVLSDNLSEVLKKIKAIDLKGLEEIRIRVDKPLMLQKNNQDYFVAANGSLSGLSHKGVQASREDVLRTIQLMSNFSIYTIGEELKQGFLTLRGGHRIGFAGRGIIENNELKLLKDISSLNIRIAREVKNCALPLLDNLLISSNSSSRVGYNVNENNTSCKWTGIRNTLIISPPGCGKTTLLRDLIRILSDGNEELDLKGYKVSLVDERSEIAACHFGVPQRDVGVRTDVLDACHKVKGINMLLRSMSPEIIAVDEIGSIEDANAIEEAINSGVTVIATAHGKNLKEAQRKRGIDTLIQNKLIDNVVVLNRKNGPGTIAEIMIY